MFSVDGFAFALNYGFGKVRFPAPLPVGSQGPHAGDADRASTTSPAASRSP